MVREYNNTTSTEFFAPTGNPMCEYIIPTISAKLNLNTATLDGERAYLQVAEEVHQAAKGVGKSVRLCPRRSWACEDEVVRRAGRIAVLV